MLLKRPNISLLPSVDKISQFLESFEDCKNVIRIISNIIMKISPKAIFCKELEVHINIDE